MVSKKEAGNYLVAWGVKRCNEGENDENCGHFCTGSDD
jgi:hypothetical protein